MDPITIFICAIIGILTGLYIFLRQRFLYWEKRNVPYITPSIPQGNLKGVGSSKHFNDVMDEIYHKFKGKMQFAGAFFGISPVAILTDLDLIKQVLIKDFNYFRDRATYVNEEEDPLSGNMFSLQGERWRMIRQKLSPTFTSGKMKFMYPTLMDVSQSFINHLNKRISQEPYVEIKEVLARFTTDIIGRAAFGIECNSLDDPNAVFRKYGQKVFAEPHQSSIVREFMNQCPKLAKMLKMKAFSPDVIAFFLNTVREAIDYREKNNISRSDFLDLLIQMKNETRPDAAKLSLMEIVAQCFVFFLGGFETSSTTMTFSLYELALNPELQDKARQDVLSTLEKHNGEMSYEAIMNMEYIGQVISESLRKYPVLFVLSRKADKDYNVPGTDKIIEKDVGITIPVYSIHHDPDIYPKPEEFRPERFSPEETVGRHSMAFLGFGDGPRNCIGMRFGAMQSRLGLAILLKNFRFKLAPTVKVPLTFENNALVLTSVGGIDLIIERIV